jgi:DNA invertase Pin-like site-specific DNA recombinase
MGLPLRVVHYARISTHDQHTLSLQLDALRTYADQQRWSVATEVQEVSSGAAQRPQRERLMQAARHRAVAGLLAVFAGFEREILRVRVRAVLPMPASKASPMAGHLRPSVMPRRSAGYLLRA